MNPRHALRPDLVECLLEDRALLALPIGLMPSQFIPTASNNSFVVPGFSMPGATMGGAYPGPSFFYLMVGSNGGSSMVGSRVGGGMSVYGMGQTIGNPVSLSISVGSGANAGGGGGGGSFSNFSGYGGNISSGYNFALNQTNNYGMTANAVGSVPEHNYDTGPVGRTPAGQETGSDTPPPANQETTPAGPTVDLGRSTLTPGVDLGNNLLRNSLTGKSLLPNASRRPGP